MALLPYDLSFQMGKIQALNTVEEAEYQTCDTSLLSGMDAFAFGYEVPQSQFPYNHWTIVSTRTYLERPEELRGC